MARDGVGRLTVEGVAREAGVARATVYRTFPGGRDELVSATVSWAVAEFFGGVWADVGVAESVTDLLERGLVAARRRLQDHEVLQRALASESDQIVPPIAAVVPMFVDLLRAELEERLEHEHVAAGVVRSEAADLLARLTLSYIGTPGSWDLDDPEAVRRLVRGQLLAGVIET